MVKRTLESAAGTSNDIDEIIVIEDESEKDGSEKDECGKDESKKNSSKIIIIEDESEKDECEKQTKKTCGKTPQKDVIALCPLSKPNTPCTHCKITETVLHKTLHCHCGSKIVLIKGRVQSALEHWENKKCTNRTNTIRSNASLSSWVTTTTIKKNAVQKPCAGLNDQTWKRPTAKFCIENCIKHSPTPYHGVKQWKVCFRLFKTTHEILLSDEQRKQLHATLESEATWLIKRHGNQESIHSPKCTRTVMTTKSISLPVCNECEELKHLQSLISALNVSYTTEEKIKYIAKIFMTGDQFQAVLIKHAELQVLQKSLEKTSKKGDEEFWNAIGYEFAFADEPDSEHIDRLRYFPTDQEITYDLTVAKKRAISLATFVGMHDASIVDTPVTLSENQVAEDISTCMAGSYDVVYNLGPKDSFEEAVAAAAEATDEQQRTDDLLSTIPEDIDQQIFNNAAMSLSTLVGPNDSSLSAARSEAALADLAGADHNINTLVLNNQDGMILEETKLLQLRVAHDSQVQKHQGNEREKIDINDLRKSPGEALKPSECSKLVAVVMRNAEAAPTGEGSYSVPLVLRRFIISIDNPKFIGAFEAQLKTSKSAQTEDLEEQYYTEEPTSYDIRSRQ
ncbi:uncharacterized protein MELLADRAFT_118356 [Melampsora larici-populina 98AG31]|uniref:Uncharacterized protein n=1 Tax=Melampsora larici-populina (strain 98AG31 / pathotype 3-4-7) TaxID=747676 RepID=F4S853_MELLP|nr:uncharacterized protein MELLADRAFT_118356 [Melampsora larici-populina 98AG31]EGF99129.1 hypothetical protein MELLADRAFT_118356 [Melampsora larici-populina 98AG31]